MEKIFVTARIYANIFVKKMLIPEIFLHDLRKFLRAYECHGWEVCVVVFRFVLKRIKINMNKLR